MLNGNLQHNIEVVNKYTRIGSLLVLRGYISKDELKTALELQTVHFPLTKLGQLLVNMGLINKHQLKEALKEQSRFRKRPLSLETVECLHKQQLLEIKESITMEVKI